MGAKRTRLSDVETFLAQILHLALQRPALVHAMVEELEAEAVGHRGPAADVLESNVLSLLIEGATDLAPPRAQREDVPAAVELGGIDDLDEAARGDLLEAGALRSR